MATTNKVRKTQLRECTGKEIFEVKPVILGGSPTDLSNKVVLTREQHVEAVCYWNKFITDLKRIKNEQ